MCSVKVTPFLCSIKCLKMQMVGCMLGLRFLEEKNPILLFVKVNFFECIYKFALTQV